MKGWPENKDNFSSVLVSYFHIRDELCTQDGLVLRGGRVDVPKSLRADMMKTLHNSHLGINSKLRRAWECFLARYISRNQVQI